MKLEQLHRYVVGLAAASCIGVALAADVGLNDKEIRLGQSVAMSGPLSEFGKDIAGGARALLESVNEKGGI